MGFIYALRSEQEKTKHTSFWAIHFCVPVMGALLFLAYYSQYASTADSKKLSLIHIYFAGYGIFDQPDGAAAGYDLAAGQGAEFEICDPGLGVWVNDVNIIWNEREAGQWEMRPNARCV